MDPTAYEVVHELEESHWFFVARRRILARLLDGLKDGGVCPTILDVGCGTGATMGFLERYGQVTGVDISPKAVQYCREQGSVRLSVADAESLPFADGSFSLVTGLDLLEHLENESRVLREVRRVLKESGCIVLFVPAFMLLWSDFDRFSGHHRRYTRGELKRRVEEAGFEITKLSYFNTFLFPAIWGVRAAKNLMGTKSLRPDLDLPGRTLNGLLAAVFAWESGLIARGHLPFGVSLLCVARKGRPDRVSDECQQ